MLSFIKSWNRHLAALFDRSAWMLILPAYVALYWIDPALARTMATWSLFFFVVAGVSVVVSRVAFPHINLSEWLTGAAKGNTASAIVVAAVIMLVAIVMLSLVMWARPA